VIDAELLHIEEAEMKTRTANGRTTMAELGWFGDPQAVHESGIEPAGDAWRPVCSCGFSAPLTHDTEDGALQAAQIHATVSSAPPQGRYSAVLDGDTVHIRCATHPGQSLAGFPAREDADGLGGRGHELREILHEHDRQFHEED
jgi:hypothetical protein